MRNAMPKLMTMYHEHFHGKHYDKKMAMDCGINYFHGKCNAENDDKVSWTFLEHVFLFQCK